MTSTTPSTTALLVIDLQNDVLPGCFETERVLRNTRTLIVAHTNQTIGSLRQPGVTVGIATHDTVALR